MGSRRFGLKVAEAIIVVRQSGIPALEGRSQRSVECLGSRLQEKMRAAPGPLHLLLFGEPLAHYGVDGRLHEGRGDAFAGPISFAVIDEAVHVRGDIGAELASGGEEFAKFG